MCTATRTDRCTPAIKNTQDYTQRYAGQEKGTYANSRAARSGQMHTSQEQHTCGAHGRALSGLRGDTQTYILICAFPLITAFSLTFSSSPIPGVSHVPYFHHGRRPCGPAALQKSEVLAKTHVPFQNPVMCYNIAQSRVLYLSSDCHFSYISVIQLMYRGLGKRTLGDPAELSSDSRLNLSRLSPRLKRHAHKHASATGPQRRVGGGVGWWAGVGVRGAGG